MADTIANIDQIVQSQSRATVSEWQRFVRTLTQRKVVVFALIIIALTVITAIFAPWLAPYDPNEKNFADSLQQPNRKHWLGTDLLGKDTLNVLSGVHAPR